MASFEITIFFYLSLNINTINWNQELF